VFVPSTDADVAAILRDASAREIRVTIAGAGTASQARGFPSALGPVAGEVQRLGGRDRGTRSRGRAASAFATCPHLRRRRGPAVLPAPTATRDQACVDRAATSRALHSGRGASLRGPTRGGSSACPWCWRMAGSLDVIRGGESSGLSTGASVPLPDAHQEIPRHPDAGPGMDWVDLFIGSEGNARRGARGHAGVSSPRRNPLLAA